MFLQYITRSVKRTGSKSALVLGIAGLVAATSSIAYAEEPSLQTSNGHFVTAVNGGGLGGPDSGPASIALHTDATSVGPWETFTCVNVGPDKMAFQTFTGNYVTAVDYGGIGGPNSSASPIHTDATKAGPWEIFTIVWLPLGKCALQTEDGHYVTAVNGGGWGGQDTANKYPIHTNATAIGPWEIFTVNY